MACVNHPDREAVARCVVCGDELCAECRHVAPDGKSYCAEHLAQAVAEGQVQAPEVPQPSAAPPQQPAGAASGESPGLAAACYFAGVVPPLTFILPVIPLASADMKQSRFMRYHAFNGLFWGLFVVVGFVLLEFALFSGGLLHLPGILMVPLRIVRALWWLAALVVSIICAVRASNRQEVRIPIVSDLAEKQVRRMG